MADTNPHGSMLLVSLDGLHPQLVKDLLECADKRERPLTWAEASKLVSAADGIRAAFAGEDSADSAPQPSPRTVQIGGVTLHQPTIGVSMVLAEAEAWDLAPLLRLHNETEATWRLVFHAYLLAHAADGAALAAVWEPRAADRAIRRWAVCLGCTLLDLESAIVDLLTGAYPALASGPAEKKSPRPSGTAASHSSPPRPMAPPSTGASASAKPMPAGSCAPSAPSTDAKPMPPLDPAASPQPQILTAPAPRPSAAIGA